MLCVCSCPHTVERLLGDHTSSPICLKLTWDSALNAGCPPAYPPERTAASPSPRSESKRWPKYIYIYIYTYIHIHISNGVPLCGWCYGVLVEKIENVFKTKSKRKTEFHITITIAGNSNNIPYNIVTIFHITIVK